MTTACFPQLFNTHLMVSRIVDVPDYDTTHLGQTTSIDLLPSEPISTTTLTLTNVVSGSAWRVEDTADDSQVDAGTASGSTVNASVPWFGADRTLRIKVRKGTASTYYKPFETQAVVGGSTVSVFISQIPDE